MIAAARDGTAAGTAARRRGRGEAGGDDLGRERREPVAYATEGVTDETLWTDAGDPALIPYRRSKTLAERAAWDFMAATRPTELVRCCPEPCSPLLTTGNIGSVAIVGRMCQGSCAHPADRGWRSSTSATGRRPHPRDDRTEAAGQRFLATGEFMWMRDMARVLRDWPRRRRLPVSTRQVPDVAVRLAARFRDPSLREITRPSAPQPTHDREGRHVSAGSSPGPRHRLDCARSLLAHGAA